MKRIVKYFVLFAVLTLVGITNVFAAEHVTTVQEFATAIGTEDNVEIILDNDINFGGSLTIDRDFDTTIDLNNHTISNAGSIFYIHGEGNLTFKDGHLVNTTNNTNNTITISGTGNYTFDNVEVVATAGTAISYSTTAGNLYLTNNSIVRTTSDNGGADAVHIQDPNQETSTAKVIVNGATLIGSPNRGAICGPATTTIAVELQKGVMFTNTKKSGVIISLNKTLKNSITYSKLYVDGIDKTLTTETGINAMVIQFGTSSDFKSVTRSTMTNGTIGINNSTSETVQALVGYPSLLVPMPDEYYKLESLSAKDASNNDIPVQSNMFTMRDSNAVISATFAAEDYHDLTVTSSSLGTITLNLEQARKGENITLTPVPTEGYGLKSFTVTTESGKTVTIIDQTTDTGAGAITFARFTMPEENVTITPTWVKIVNITSNVTNGDDAYVKTPSGPAFVGDRKQISIVPNAGFYIQVFTVRNANTNEAIPIEDSYFTVPDAPVVITIDIEIFRANLQIIITDPVGLVISDKKVGTNELGFDIYELSYTEKPGYKFDRWIVKDSSNNPIEVDENNRFVQPNDDVTVTAIATNATTYAINFTDQANGTIKLDTNGNETYAGREVTITPQPSAGYKLDEIHVYKHSNHEEITLTNLKFTMPAEEVDIEFTFTEGTHVKNYSELLTAIQNDDLIILDNDIEDFEGSIQINRDVTIDLNNRTISSSNGIFNITGTANVTIKNGKLDNTLNANSYNTINISSTGVVNLEKVEVISDSGSAVSYSTPAGKLNISKNSILRTTKDTSGSDALHVQNPRDNNNVVIDSTAEIHINQATLIGAPSRGAICGPVDSTITIEIARATLRTNDGTKGSLIFYSTFSQYITTYRVYIEGTPSTLPSGTTLNNASVAQFGKTDDEFHTVFIADDMTGGTLTTDTTKALVYSRVKLVPVPEEGMDVDTITVKDSQGNNLVVANNEFVMPDGNVTVTATFTRLKRRLSTNQNDTVRFGTISFGSTRYEPGETVSFTVKYESGYHLSKFIITDNDGVDVTDQVTYDVNAKTLVMPNFDITITPVYIFEGHLVKVGKITGVGGLHVDGRRVTENTSVTLDIRVGNGYRLNGVILRNPEGVDVTEELQFDSETNNFKMPNYDVTVDLQFAANTYTITAVNGAQGTVKLSATKAATSSKVTVTVTPNFGYKATGIKIMKTDGTVVRTLTGGNVATIQMEPYDIKIAGVYSIKTSNDNITAKIYSSTYNSINVGWERATDVAGYYVYQSTNNKTYKLVKTVTSNTITNFNNTGLKTGTKYYYKILTYKLVSGKKVNGKYTNIVSATPTLAKVATVKASTNMYTKIDLSWSKVTGATGYYVYRATAINGTYKKIATTKKLTYTDKKAANGGSYYYKIVPYRTVSGKKKAGPYSNPVRGTRLNEKVTFTLTPGSQSITVNITRNASAKQYVIYRATSKNGKYTKVVTLSQRPDAVIRWTNGGLKGKKKYYYKIALVNGNTSKYSAKVNAKTLA